MAIWKTMPEYLPAPATEYWVRLNYWFGPPFKATYNSEFQEWTSVTNAITYPAWSVSRYRDL